MKRYQLPVVLALALAAGCGSSGKTSGSTSDAPNTIRISNFAFSPSTLTVSPGATVTVTNKDSTTHTVTSSKSGQFNTGDVSGGGTATFTAPSAPGSYSFICIFHSSMKGTLVVK